MIYLYYAAIAALGITSKNLIRQIIKKSQVWVLVQAFLEWI